MKNPGEQLARMIPRTCTHSQLYSSIGLLAHGHLGQMLQYASIIPRSFDLFSLGSLKN